MKPTGDHRIDLGGGNEMRRSEAEGRSPKAIAKRRASARAGHRRINKILVGWDNYFQCGYPTRMFDKVNWYVRNRLYLHFNRKSQRGYVLKYAPTFYGELQAMGLHMLRWRRK